MVSFERLIREHEAIADRAVTLRAAAGGDAPSAATHAALHALSAILAAHLATEDAEVYPRLILSADEGAASAAREAVHDFESLARDWASYLAAWSEQAITADRLGFAAATETILTRLERRVAVENELLYPMALQSAHIRLRD